MHKISEKNSESNTSRDIAKKRLINLITNDRTDGAEKILDMLKSDMAGIITQYLDVDAEKLSISIIRSQNGSVPMLVASVPFADNIHS